MKKSTITLIILSSIVLLTVLYAFIDGGSPSAAKNMRFDQTRIQHIQSIESLMYTYYQKNMKLPSTIQESITDGAYREPFIDPDTKSEYIYKKINASEYQLCATFGTDTTKHQNRYVTESKYSHPSGYYCYAFNATQVR